MKRSRLNRIIYMYPVTFTIHCALLFFFISFNFFVPCLFKQMSHLSPFCSSSNFIFHHSLFLYALHTPSTPNSFIFPDLFSHFPLLSQPFFLIVSFPTSSLNTFSPSFSFIFFFLFFSLLISPPFSFPIFSTLLFPSFAFLNCKKKPPSMDDK